MRYVITGTAASGTRWASELMNRLGSSCTHQRVYRVSGFKQRKAQIVEGDSSFFAAPIVPARKFKTLLLIRDPLNVVRSLDQMTGFLEENGTEDDLRTFAYIAKHVPSIEDEPDRLGRLIRYVSSWDRRLLEHKLVSIHYIDRDTDNAELVNKTRWLSGSKKITQRRIREAKNDLGTKTNTHGGNRSEITWDTIREHPSGDALVRRAIILGYIIDE